METPPSEGIGSVLESAILFILNLTMLMVVAISISTHYDNKNTVNSATPFSDGAIFTMIVVVVLVVLNGAVLCLSPSTRRIGAGALIAAVAAVPVGFVVLTVAYASGPGVGN